MNDINVSKNLLESLSAPLSIITALVGGIVWLSSLNNRASENEKEIEILKLDFRRFQEDLYDLEVKISRLEEKINIVIDGHRKDLH